LVDGILQLLTVKKTNSFLYLVGVVTLGDAETKFFVAISIQLKSRKKKKNSQMH
jgi:hypothetical protein